MDGLMRRSNAQVRSVTCHQGLWIMIRFQTSVMMVNKQCLREVGSDFGAARGQSGHASTAATFKCHQNNSVRFAGSAQMLAQAGSLRAPPMAEVATCTFLYMRVLEGSAHGRSRHLHVPPHARSWVWLAKRTWTKWPRLHDGSCSLLRGIRPTYCTG